MITTPAEMRLIDANWVIDHLKPYEPSDEEWIVTGGTALRLICKAIDNAPTVDAVPVVHCHRVDNGSAWECSECGAYLLYGANYCYSCGAKIDGADG